MQIFFLSRDPRRAAQYACDKHAVNQPKESLQIISTVWYVLYPSQWKIYFARGWLLRPWTNPKHPVVLWAMDTTGNYVWLLNHFGAQLEEYTARYNKVHAYQTCYNNIVTMMPDPSFERDDFEPMKLEFQAIPVELKQEDAVQAYRAFYRRDKARFAKWAHSDPPEWW